MDIDDARLLEEAKAILKEHGPVSGSQEGADRNLERNGFPTGWQTASLFTGPRTSLARPTPPVVPSP